MATDGEIEGTVTLFLQFFDGDVLADFDAAFDFDAKFLHDFDFRIDDGAFELVRRNAITEHAARLGVLFKHGRTIAFDGQVVGGA